MPESNKSSRRYDDRRPTRGNDDRRSRTKSDASDRFRERSPHRQRQRSNTTSSSYGRTPADPPVAKKQKKQEDLLKGSILYIGDTQSLNLNSGFVIGQLKAKYAAVQKWNIADEVLAQSLSFGEGTPKIDDQKDAVANVEALATICKVLCVIIVAPADATEKQLNVMHEIAKKAKPVNIAMVLPPYLMKEEKYEQADLTNLNGQRAIVAKMACEQKIFMIDVTPPHRLKTASKNIKVWVNRLWNIIETELIPPPSYVDATANAPTDGKMQGLAALQKKFS